MLLVYWRRRRMCASTAAVLAFASHAAATASATFRIASASAFMSGSIVGQILGLQRVVKEWRSQPL